MELMNRLKMANEKLSELENRSIEIIQVEGPGDKHLKKKE